MKRRLILRFLNLVFFSFTDCVYVCVCTDACSFIECCFFFSVVLYRERDEVVVQCYIACTKYIYIPINIYIHIIYIKYKYYVGNCFFCVLFVLFTPCGFHIVTCIGKLLQGPGFYFFAFFPPRRVIHGDGISR